MRPARRACTAAAALLAALASLVGCARPVYESRPHPPLSRVHSHGTVVGRPLALAEAIVTRHVVPLPRSDHGVVLAGDVHGRGGSEIVVVERSGVLVYGTDGRLLAKTDAAEPVLAGGVLSDVDRDGLADVVTGVAGGADPVVRAFNGRGNEILSRRLETLGEAFGAVLPAAVRDDALYVRATENWVAGPRGVVRLSRERLEPVWFSAVPTSVTGIVLAGDRVVVSNRTQHNGEFDAIGVDARTRFGFDARPQLLVLDAGGSPRVERALGRSDPQNVQSVRFLPMGAQTVVAHLVAGEERILLADAATGAVFADRNAGSRVRSLVSFPSSERVGYAVVTGADGRWELAAVSRRGEILAAGRGSGPRPRLLALVDGESERTAFLAIADRRLVLVDASRTGGWEVRPGPPTAITGSVIVTQNDSEVLVAGLGASLELIRIPFVGASAAEDHR